MYMFDENEEENEKKIKERTDEEGSPRSQARAAAYPVFSNVFSNVCAHAVENDRERLKIEPVFILMLSVYYYYITNIFNSNARSRDHFEL